MTRLCQSCGTPIFYATTGAGKNQALDLKPDRKGNIAVVNGVAVPLSPERAANYFGKLYMPHAARHGKTPQPKLTGLTAITGLSVFDEVDRLARALMRHAARLTGRQNPDFNDCRSAWPYFLAANPGIPKETQGLIAPRVRQIVAERSAGSEARA